MVQLYGAAMSRRDVAAHAGSLSQFAGVRQMVLADGVERGIRMLEFRTGTGLRFTVLVDRAMDIADCEYRGAAIGWHSPAGFKHPGLHEYEGEEGLSWLRSLSGLMVTCGLDHTLFMDGEPPDHYVYKPRRRISHSLHGRVGTLPARLTGYGEKWEGDRCVLWCEGVVSQGTVFGEDLQLTRRIESDVGSNEIRLCDSVTNHGFYRTPHMFLYHINVGHPVLAAGARYVAPIEDVVWAAHAGAEYQKQGVGYRLLPGPQTDFHEQVWQHELRASADGRVSVAVLNESLGLGFEVTTLKDQFPCTFEWQNFQAGQYALAIEPSTNHVLGHAYARERDEVIWLGHDEARVYDTTFRVLDGPGELAQAEARIAALCTQPAEEFPKPSGDHRPLRRS